MLSELKPYPEYRGSGISWLGEIPSHWESQRQQNVARLLVSNVDKKVVDGEKPVRLCNYVDVYRNDRIRNGSTYMKATATQSEIESFRLKHGDVVITKDSERWDDIGVPALIEYEAEDFICGYHLAILRTRSKRVISEFLYYATRSPEVAAQYWVSANGVTRFGLSQNTIKNILMPVPSLEEQAQIVRFLRFAENRITHLTRNKRRLIGLLREQKQAIIKQAVTRGIDPNVTIKPSGVPWLGDIPVHWALDRGKFYFREIDERSTTGDEELLSVSHITGVTPRSQKNINMFKAESYVGSKICRPGQIAINTMWAWMAAVGVSKHLGVISPSYHTYEQLDDRRFNDDFLDTLLRSTPFKDMYTVHSSGITSSRLRLYPEDFLNLRFPCPPLEEQKAIVNWLDNETQTTSAAISRAEREIELMNEYRTRLISDVVTGKVDVRDVIINDDEELDDLESDALDIVDDDEGMVTLDDEESTD